jgi:hypothetical protein
MRKRFVKECYSDPSCSSSSKAEPTKSPQYPYQEKVTKRTLFSKMFPFSQKEDHEKTQGPPTHFQRGLLRKGEVESNSGPESDRDPKAPPRKLL